jgi:hypothetical protein
LVKKFLLATMTEAHPNGTASLHDSRIDAPPAKLASLGVTLNEITATECTRACTALAA